MMEEVAHSLDLEPHGTCVRAPLENQDQPYKKKLRTKLVDLFKRVSNGAIPDDSAKVYLRIKPFTENEDSSQRCLSVIPEKKAIVATAPDSSHAYKNSTRGHGKSSHEFVFSEIFDENTNQAEFFNSTMLENTKQFIGGQNTLVFSYGVTSSGKTYTIQGKPQDAGILPRCLDVLFNSIKGKQILNPDLKPAMFNSIVRLSDAEISAEQKIKKQTLKMGAVNDVTMMSLMGDEVSVLSDTALSSSGAEDILDDVNRDREKLKVEVDERMRFGIWVSFAEVYNEQVFDLLTGVSQKSGKRPTLKISDDKNKNPYIKGLKEIHVESADEAYRLLTIGQRNLQTACTRLNHCSSRSHCIFTIKIVRVVDKEGPSLAMVSTLSLCDLAGSERYSKTQASGDRLKEAGNINTSLMTLGRCIETLRHNQLHRDQQKMVPFRDSKLTRILQNFFNGCGRAAMIVNVSQAIDMFDDTLHVFKFSAIAKQVKYEKLPEVKNVLKEKKRPPIQSRQTISWETQESKKNLMDAQACPLPDDDEENEENSEDAVDGDIEENGSGETSDIIKALEARCEHLTEMIVDLRSNDVARESHIRKEVTVNMQQQMVIIEETYSTMMKDAAEDAEEAADERVNEIIEVYESRLQRIQKKVDDDDEWVSSLLYHQEKMKVEERDAKILVLEKQLQEKQKHDAKNDSIDMGDSVLVETLTLKLQEATDANASKTKQVDELQQSLSEAQKGLAKAHKELDLQTRELDKFKEEALNKMTSKDVTIASLEEDCKELQGEIERLQDQMSQIDDQSRCRYDLDSSTASEAKSRRIKSLNSSDAPVCNDTKPCSVKIEQENTCDEEALNMANQKNKEMHEEMTALRTELDNVQEEMETLKEQKQALESAHLSSKEKLEAVTKDFDVTQKSLHGTEEKLSMATRKNKGFTEEVTALQTELEKRQEEVKTLKGQKETLELASFSSIEQLEAVIEDLDGCKRSLHETKEELDMATQRNNKVSEEITILQTELENKNEEVKTLKEQKESLESAHSSSTDKLEVVTKDFNACKQSLHETEEELKMSREAFEQCTQDLSGVREKIGTFEETLKQLEEEKRRLTCENEALETAKAELTEQFQSLEHRFEQLTSADKACEISQMVKVLEEKTPLNTPNKAGDKSGEEDDDEIVFNMKDVGSSASKTPARCTQLKAHAKTPLSESKYAELALRLKDSELANVALRNKLKHEEDDYCKREQALIHGYTAEIESFKYELAKSKTRKDNDGSTKQQRGKKRAHVEVSLCSSVSESCNESIEEKRACHSGLESVGESCDKSSSDVIQNALTLANMAKDQLESELKEKEMAISKLNDSVENSILLRAQAESAVKILTAEIEDLTQKLTKAESGSKLSEKKVKSLNAEKEELTQKLNDITDKMDVADSKAESASKLNEEKVKSLTAEIEDLTQKLTDITDKRDASEGNLQQVKDEQSKLQKLLSQSTVVEERCANLEQRLLEKDSLLKLKEEDHQRSLETLKENVSCTSKTNSEAVSTLQQQVAQISSMLEEKSKELARVEGLRQEEAAEVAQKLILLEKEKKAAERRGLDAKAKEEEMGLKFQGYTTLSQEVDELRSQLQKAASAEEQNNARMSKQQEELLSLQEEKLKAVEEIKTKLADAEQAQEEERQAKQTALEEKQKLLLELSEMKVEMIESEKTMGQQEDFLTKQDAEIKDLTSELKWVKSENVKLDSSLTRKDLELASLNKEKSLASNNDKHMDELKSENRRLQEEKDKTKEELKDAQQQFQLAEIRLQELTEKKKTLEKEVQKYESINKRNKEEMEHWKAERDSMVKKLEQCISKMTQEKNLLTKEVEELKKGNSDLAQAANNISCLKDSLISDLKKSNNTMSIQLANAQGMSPPPKMATPDTVIPGRIPQFEKEQDAESDDHLEIDVTPLAARKGKKRQATSRTTQLAQSGPSSSVDLEATPEPKSLRTIKEESESPRSPRSRVSGLANEIFSSLSPLAKLSSKKESSKKKSKKSSSMQPPFETMAFAAPSEDASGQIRRSSRLRSSTSKHSAV